MHWRYRDTVLSIAVLANFAQFGARLVVSPLVPRLIETFQTSKAEIGLVLTGMWALFALAQYPSGVLADVHGERRVVLAALVATGGASLLLAAAPSFPAFAALLLLLGAGAGLYFSVGTALLASLYDETGLPLSLHSMGAPAAGLVIPPTVVAVAVRYGWRSGFLLGAAVAACAALLVVLRVRPRPPARPDDRVRDRLRPAVLLDLLSTPGVAFTFLLSTLGMYAFQSFLSFFPTFLVEYRGLTETTASSVFSLVFVLSAVGLPVAGRVSDRVGRDVTLAVVFLASAAGWAVLVGVPGRVGLAGAIFLGAGLSWGGVLQARFMDHLPSTDRGTGFGLARTGFILLGASGNVVTGTLAEVAGWPAAVGVVVAVLVAGAVAVGANWTRRR